MPLPPGTRLGPYEVLSPLGAGGMGEVYRAKDPRLGRDVAVKVLPSSFSSDPDRMRRFEQEARAAGLLNHPNITTVYDIGTSNGSPYVVQELLEGETLRSELGGGRLPQRKVLDYAQQIAQGLAAAHDKGIVHRDLKPENLFVTKEGRVKILDFGLAKLTHSEEGGAATNLPTADAGTTPGLVMGTIAYMSPEQVKGKPADARSDIFAFGAILYEMLAGTRTFRGDSAGETMAAILKEDPPDLSITTLRISPGLDRIVRHCLEKNPERRFRSAHDLAFDLEALSGASAMGGSAATAARTGLLPLGRIATRLVMAAALVAAAAAGMIAGRATRPAPMEATFSELTFRQGSISSARFTPDGGTVVYSAAWEGTPTELFSTRPGSPESRSLGLPPADTLSVSATGEMAILLDPHFTAGFERSGTLARAPLAGGVARQVLEDVQDADWAPDGQGLAVARAVEGRNRLEYPIGKPLYETEKWISSVRFSRDGRWIAFIDHPIRGDNRGRVAAVDLGGNVKFLTEMFSGAGGVAWSPSGDEIWFTAARTGNVQTLYAADLSGSLRVISAVPASISLQDISPSGSVLLTRDTWRRGIRGLGPGDESERDLSWLDWSRPSDLSADGEWLLFEEQGQGGGPGYSVYLRRMDGSPAVKLGEGYSLSLSPDGNWAASVSVSRPDHLVYLPRGPGEPRTVHTAGLSPFSMRWLPDGKRIVLQASEKGRLSRLYVMEEDGGNPKPITPEAAQLQWTVSHDGNWVAVKTPDGAPRLVPVDGGEPRSIPGLETEDVVVTWGPDAGSVLVARGRGLPRRIDLVDLDTGRSTPWKELIPADRAGMIDIGFIHFSDDGRSYVYSYRRALSTLYLATGLR